MYIIKKITQNRIIKIGSMSLIATIMTRAINLISVPIFSRILTTSEYGQIEGFMTYVNIFLVILGLDIHGAVGKGRLDHNEDEDGFLCSGVLLTTITAILIVSIINIFYVYLKGIFKLNRLLVNIMLIYSYAMFLISFRTADYNFSYEYKKNMRMNVTIAVLNLVLSIFFIKTIWKNDHILGRIFGATIPTLISAVFVYWGYVHRGKRRFSYVYNKYFLKFGVPLIPHNLSHLVLSSSDRIMINNIVSTGAGGIYSLSYTLGMMIEVATQAMNQVYSPWLFRKLQVEEYEYVRKIQRLYLLLYCFVVTAVLTISPEIVKVIGDRRYWDGIHIILWIVFATFLNFTYTLYVNIEFFYRRTALISAGTLMAAIINIILNYCFLEKYGYYFAAASTVISYGAMLIFHAAIVNCVLKIKMVDNLFLFSVITAVFIITCLMQFFLASIIARIIICVICELIFGGILLLLKKRCFD